MRCRNIIDFVSYMNDDGYKPSEIVRELRTTYKVSQKKLAQGIGSTQQSIALMEAGRRKIDVDTLGRIFAFFQENYCKEDDERLPELPDPDPLTPEAVERNKKSAFLEWLYSGCGIDIKEKCQSGVDGYILRTSTSLGSFEYFISADVFDLMPEELARYTAAIIKANVARRLDPDHKETPQL